MAKPTANATLRLDPRVHALLRAHAWIRNVKVNELESDILHAWCKTITDFSYPAFDKKLLGFGSLPSPPTRYPGYLTTLGFVDPRPDLHADAPDFAAAPTDHTSSAPASEDDLALLDVDTTEVDL